MKLLRATRRMSHLDAALFALETRTNLMNLGLLATFEPAADGVDVAAVLRERLITLGPESDYLRCIVKASHLGFAPPRLVESGPIDVDYHVQVVRLPEPGDDAVLDEWVAQELSVQLDRSKPLWRMYVLEGLQGGGFGLFVKGHHGMMDGTAALRIALQILDGEHIAITERLRSTLLSGGAEALRDVAHAAVSFLKWPLRVLRLAVDPTRHNVKLSNLPAVPQMFTAPRTPYNRSITAERAVIRLDLPLTDVIAVRRDAGCTGTDVVLELVASAVRSVLKDRGALPDRPLVAMLPFAQTGEEWSRRSGNRLAFIFVSMATDIADPHRRLAAIAESSRAAREATRLRGADLWERYAGMVLPGPLHRVAATAERFHLSNRIRPLASLIVSNLTGPRLAMSLAGSKMTGLWPFGPPKDGGALNVTVVSYQDSVHVGIQSDVSLAEDLPKLQEAFRHALAELVQADAGKASAGS